LGNSHALASVGYEKVLWSETAGLPKACSIGEVNMMRVPKIIQAALIIMALWPIAQAAGFGMGGGVAPGVGVGMSIGNPAMAGSSLSYGHGSPAATNPAVAAMEARQREAQVAIEQARNAGKNVRVAQADRIRGDGALESNQPDQAMAAFDRAERDLGIIPNTTAMGAYSRSALGSVTPGGTELSGAIVH
jgi:hypothetical protein